MSRTEVEIIRDGKIVAADMGVDSVLTAAIGNLQVTTDKIADRSVTAIKLAADINFFPTGGIVLWSGSASNIPTGWTLCDGSNGTPDLRNKFIIGAGSGYSVNSQGGTSSISLGISNLPSHSHSMSSAGNHGHSGSSSGSGTHSHSGSTSGANANHSHSGATSGAGDHAHTANWFRGVGQGGATWSVANGSDGRQTNPAGNHAHSFTTSGHSNDHGHSFSTSGGGHSHSVSVGSGGDHSHSISSAGSGAAFNIMPPYYALCYIMKT